MCLKLRRHNLCLEDRWKEGRMKRREEWRKGKSRVVIKFQIVIATPVLAGGLQEGMCTKSEEVPMGVRRK